MSKEDEKWTSLPGYNRRDKSRTISDDRGIFYFKCLCSLFTQGVDRYAQDTSKRANFVSENQHLFAGTVLCSMFSFLESILGGKSKDKWTWIDRHGGRATAERSACVSSETHLFTLIVTLVI